jgi:hypothetical protein
LIRVTPNIVGRRIKSNSFSLALGKNLAGVRVTYKYSRLGCEEEKIFWYHHGYGKRNGIGFESNTTTVNVKKMEATRG